LLINKTLFTKFHNILLVLFEKKLLLQRNKAKKRTNVISEKKITLPVVLTPEAKKQVAVLTKKANET